MLIAAAIQPDSLDMVLMRLLVSLIYVSNYLTLKL